ncbi:hypothetical protein FN846DRAFT_914128 [Sphaerosporella brunnea]|uniref:CASP C-terminal domain-containing protein n=1 Tax=Sphaerosporella brunnea TaxID=1250544 RepID=A0A5J5EF60_9PEZI|nr:hypothetical protein FN846DRAFT_914128 [Sphaerosporella brunnea]
MTLPRSTIRLRRHAQRRFSAVTATPLVRPTFTEYHMKAPVLVATREFSLFRGILSTTKREQQRAAVPAAVRQLSSATVSHRGSHPRRRLLNQVRKEVARFSARNGELQQEITGLKQEITGLKQEMTGLKAGNKTLVNRMRIVGTHTLERVIYMSSFRSWLKESVASRLRPLEAKRLLKGLKSAGNNKAQPPAGLSKVRPVLL